MTVDSVSNYSSIDGFVQEYATATEEQSDMITQDEFLKIFLAQLEYQDPLNPMEMTDMSGQLCQYSMLATQYSTNEILEEISEKLDAQATDNVLDYIGKEITLGAGAITLDDGQVFGGSFTIEESASIEIAVYDYEGTEIVHLYPGQMDAGSHEIEWDGTDSSGARVEDGTYTCEVIATDSNGQEVSVITTYTGIVTGIAYENSYPYLMVGDLPIDPATVAEVKDSAATSG
jgi:flagellar basal-body rod modification protein FlgD